MTWQETQKHTRGSGKRKKGEKGAESAPSLCCVSDLVSLSSSFHCFKEPRRPETPRGTGKPAYLRRLSAHKAGTPENCTFSASLPWKYIQPSPDTHTTDYKENHLAPWWKAERETSPMWICNHNLDFTHMHHRFTWVKQQQNLRWKFSLKRYWSNGLLGIWQK